MRGDSQDNPSRYRIKAGITSTVVRSGRCTRSPEAADANLFPSRSRESSCAGSGAVGCVIAALHRSTVVTFVTAVFLRGDVELLQRRQVAAGEYEPRPGNDAGAGARVAAAPAPAQPTETGQDPASDPAAGDDSAPTGWGPTYAEWRAAAAVAHRLTVPELAGNVIVASYAGSRAPIALIRRLHLGGVIVSTPNIVGVQQQRSANRAMQRAAHRPWPLIVAVDQEGGRVSRLGPPITQFPTYMSLGAAGRTALARRVAGATGLELHAAGFTMVFAPDADVTMGPSDVAIGSRSAGSDPDQVAALVAASVRGFAQSGVVPVVKHFPGHGSVRVDSHVGLPHQRHTLTWLEHRDFKPFARAIAAQVPAVMIGHIAMSRIERGIPADLSAPAVDLLRTRLGFGGLVVTDSLQMAAVTAAYGSAKAAVVALRAGADIVLMPRDPARAREAIIDAVRRGGLSRQRLEEAVARQGAVMAHQASTAPSAGPRSEGHSDLAYRVSAAAVTVVAGRCRGPYATAAVKPIGPRYLVAGFSAAAQDAGLRLGHGQRVLLLDRTSRIRPASIAVSVDTPYRLLQSSRSPTRLALYGSTEQAWRVLVAVLQGKRSARGHLPVGGQGMRSGCRDR